MSISSSMLIPILLVLVLLLTPSLSSSFTQQYTFNIPTTAKPQDAKHSSLGRFLALLQTVNATHSQIDIRNGFTSVHEQLIKDEELCADCDFTSISFNSQESLLAIGMSDAHVSIWSYNETLGTFQNTGAIFKPSDQIDSVSSLAWMPDSEHIVIGILNHKVVVWNWKSSKSYQTQFSNQFVFDVDSQRNQINFTANSWQFVVVGGSNGNSLAIIFNFNVDQGITQVDQIKGFSSYSLKSVSYNPTSTTLYICDSFGSYYKYDLFSSKITPNRVLIPSTFYKIQLQSNQKIIALSYPNNIAIFDETGTIKQKLSTSYNTYSLSTFGGYLFLFNQQMDAVILGRCSFGEFYIDETDACEICLVECSVCSGQKDICFSCVTGYYLDGAQCKPCAIGCLECKSDTQCTTCNTAQHFVNKNGICICDKGFYYADKECLPCSRGCQYCQSVDICIQCQNSYIITEGKCICGPGTYDNGNQCLPCIKGCKICINGQSCQQCQYAEHYILDHDKCICDKSKHFIDNGQLCVCENEYYEKQGQCIACGIGCQKCVSIDQCTKCKTGLQLKDGSCICADKSQYIDMQTGTCKFCSQVLQFCVQCQNPTHCSTCNPDSKRSPQPDTCQCNAPLFPSPTKQCLPCTIAGCIKCQDLQVCKICDAYNNWQQDLTNNKCKCMSHYIQIQDQCLQCQRGCLQCTVDSCLTCDVVNHWIYDKQSHCLCQDGYFDNDLICQKCIYGCLTCLKADQCTVCDQANHFFNKNGICVCNEGYFLEAGTCKSCAILPHCLICSSGTTCTTCQQTYTLNTTTHSCTCPAGKYIDNKDQLCKGCGPACLTCTGSDACTKCQDGYILKNGLCSKKKGILKGAEIVVGVVILAAILFGLLKG